MCRIRKAKTTDEAAQFAGLALRGHLFVSGWILSQYLQGIKKGEDDSKIAIAEENDKIIGVAIKRNYEARFVDGEPTIMIYVKPDFRNNKIGSKLIKKLHPRKYDDAGRGIKGSKTFWEKTGIKCF